MSTVAIFIALVAGIVLWILLVRRLTARSWESRSDTGDFGAIGAPPARIALWMFLAVVTSVFGLFFSAYTMRMHHGDWHHISEPDVLWVNTVVLILASVALEYSRRAARKQDMQGLKIGLVLGGALTLAFLAGQLVAWQQIRASGQFMTSSPAIAFFYVLTAVHGLHLLGGLTVWGKTVGRLAGGAELIDVRLSVELCAVYWHYLLLVWGVLFALLLAT